MPFADTFTYSEAFLQRFTSALPRIIWAVVGALVAGEFASLFASQSGTGIVLALIFSIALRTMTLGSVWNNVDGLWSAWLGALISSLISLARVSIWDLVLRALELLLKIKDVAQVGFGKVYSMISIPSSIIYQAIIIERLGDLGAIPIR